MTVCVDASIIVRALTPEHGAVEALSWLKSKVNEAMIAPPFLPVEFGTALRRKMISRQMTATECAEALRFYGRLGIVYVWDDSIMESAFNLAVELSQPTVYDAAYLAVAVEENCEYWTLDRRFAEAASPLYPRIRFLNI